MTHEQPGANPEIVWPTEVTPQDREKLTASGVVQVIIDEGQELWKNNPRNALIEDPDNPNRFLSIFDFYAEPARALQSAERALRGGILQRKKGDLRKELKELFGIVTPDLWQEIERDIALARMLRGSKSQLEFIDEYIDARVATVPNQETYKPFIDALEKCGQRYHQFHDALQQQTPQS